MTDKPNIWLTKTVANMTQMSVILNKIPNLVD